MRGRTADIAAVVFLAVVLVAVYIFIILPGAEDGGSVAGNLQVTGESPAYESETGETETGTARTTELHMEQNENTVAETGEKEESDIGGEQQYAEACTDQETEPDGMPLKTETVQTPESEEAYQETESTSVPEPETTTIQETNNTLQEQDVNEESQAADILKQFYSYSEKLDEYREAMELLADDFVLELNIFKQFGVEQLGKNDVTGEHVNAFAGMLMSAELESIIAERIEDGIAVIEYFHVMSVGEDNNLRLRLVATLAKTQQGWRITSIKEKAD